jgi:hypothetical protein
MYASDLTHQKRAATNFRNLQLQKEWFATGQTIRILGQKGGNDYSYMSQLNEGCIADKCWQLYVPTTIKLGNGPISDSTAGLTPIDFSVIYDAGYGAPLTPIPGILDDAFIPIPMGGMDFFFDEVNYGATNDIKWNTNNILFFGTTFNTNDVSLNRNQGKAIMLGNFDRLCSGIFCSTLMSNGGYSIIKFIVSFSNYYTDTTNLSAGKLQVRLIKEVAGKQRQWVEVGVISAPPSPGYSNNPSVSYPSGVDSSGNAIDSNSVRIDQTKNSPWDISNGTKFLEVAGNTYSTEFPVAGTTMLYESDKTGTNWRFTQNAYIPF